jgi:hypothetical protein
MYSAKYRCKYSLFILIIFINYIKLKKYYKSNY